jgi:SAM-dependent methyltransferase
MLSKVIFNAKFKPGLFGLFINPFFWPRYGLYTSIKKFADKVDGNILDVGCGKKPYMSLFNYISYIGMDIENEGHDHVGEDIDVFYNGKTFPFEDGHFDSIIANQVFEHVFNPGQFIAECNRVLKCGVMFLITVPFVWDEHEIPNDFGRYSSFGIAAILKEYNFEIVQQLKTLNDFRAPLVMIILYMYKIKTTNLRVLDSLTTLIFIAPLNFFGLLVFKFLPKNNDLFIDNVVLCKKTI